MTLYNYTVIHFFRYQTLLISFVVGSHTRKHCTEQKYTEQKYTVKKAHMSADITICKIMLKNTL